MNGLDLVCVKAWRDGEIVTLCQPKPTISDLDLLDLLLRDLPRESFDRLRENTDGFRLVEDHRKRQLLEDAASVHEAGFAAEGGFEHPGFGGPVGDPADSLGEGCVVVAGGVAHGGPPCAVEGRRGLSAFGGLFARTVGRFVRRRRGSAS